MFDYFVVFDGTKSVYIYMTSDSDISLTNCFTKRCCHLHFNKIPNHWSNFDLVVILNFIPCTEDMQENMNIFVIMN